MTKKEWMFYVGKSTYNFHYKRMMNIEQLLSGNNRMWDVGSILEWLYYIDLFERMTTMIFLYYSILCDN